MSKRHISLAAAVALSAISSRAHATTYDVLEVFSPDRSYKVITVAYGINNHGEITGYVSKPNGVVGFKTTYGNFAIFQVPGADVGTTTAFGINDNDQVIGAYQAGGHSHGFVDFNGVFTTIDVPGATDTFGRAINGYGQIVGSYLANGESLGFEYSNGVFTTTDVPFPHIGGVAASGINNSGQTTGTYTDPSGIEHGYLETNGTFVTLDAPGGPPGLIGSAINTYAEGINASGEVVGFTRGGLSRSFTYSNGVYDTFETLNDYSDDFVAVGINDRGQVTGRIAAGSSSFEAFPIVPVPGPVMVPELASLAMLALGLGGLGLLRRRRAA